MGAARFRFTSQLLTLRAVQGAVLQHRCASSSSGSRCLVPRGASRLNSRAGALAAALAHVAALQDGRWVESQELQRCSWEGGKVLCSLTDTVWKN